ncbi:hypothetical protein B0H13DRAFT_1610700 [Mycena leptocephala]|nr:hypothetical protein B0H13DRAFT_1610700 [Mycena leptocephala]
MADYGRDHIGRARRLFVTRVNSEDEFSPEWIGVNKSCEAIPGDALNFIDSHHHQMDDSPVDEFGRFVDMEWADQPDWYNPEDHARGWIPLAKENDSRRGAWAKQTKSLMPVVGPMTDGKWRLADLTQELMKDDVAYFQDLMEEICLGTLYDEETHLPALFDIERISGRFSSELDVHKMVMDARRAVLNNLGHISWWMAGTDGKWMMGLSNEVVQKVLDLELMTDEKRGYLISVNRDWKSINFLLLLHHNVPFFFVWGLFESRDPRFRRLSPGAMGEYLAREDGRLIEDLWHDDIPIVNSEFEAPARYDKFLQLKIDPYSRPRCALPKETEGSGTIEHWVIDFQYWSRRRLADDEKAEDLHKLYHHVVVQSKSEQVTRVIFQRFFRKPRNEVLCSNSEIMDEDIPEPDLPVIRERFKGRCAPEYGQCFDPETGVERRRPITKDEPFEVVARYEHQLSREGSAYGLTLPSPRRSASPPRRGRTIYPIRAPTPPDYRRRLSGGETMSEREDRRAGWLNVFADWGRPATYDASLWRMPFEYSWNPDVLQHGYLIIGEAAEFRLRFQVVTNTAIRFPRHVLEVAMERGIQFSIGFKAPDCARFRPKEDDEDMSRFVTKAVVDLRAKGPRLEDSPSLPIIYRQYRGNMGKMARSPQARALVTRGGAASWLMRAFVGTGLVRKVLEGPSVQVTVHHAGANDSADANCIDVSWDDVSEGDYEAIFGYIQGGAPETDKYLFPTDEMVEEFSDHYYREWNPFCDKTFRHIKDELDDGRGKARTRSEWKHYFQSSNRGIYKPKLVVNRLFVEEGLARMKEALQYSSWNKKRLCDIARDIPAAFQHDF